MCARISIYTLSEYEEVMGSEMLNDLLGSYSCPLNREVEDYLKDENRARHSSLMSSSVTYLAFDSKTSDLLGYFTLLMKSYSVLAKALSSRNRGLIKRFAEVDDKGNFSAPVYLIAQLGKNYAIPEARRISGAELLGQALDVFRRSKKAIGGKLVMVEREIDRPKLLAFYKNNGFKSWTMRLNEKDGVVFDQMFAELNDKPSVGGVDVSS